MRKNLKISAVIPCRKGSTRCKNKNLRKFGNTTLLENKIKMLKKSKFLSEIVVSSNDDDALEIAKKYNVVPSKRSDDLCLGDVPPAKVHESLAKSVSNEVFVYTSPVAPFMSTKTFDKIIEFWINNPQYEVVCAGSSIKNFIWKDNKPHNFEIDGGIVGTQELSEDYKIACADSALITFKNNVMDNTCLFGDGDNVFLYEINELESLDIDWNLDFVISESLFHRSFKTIELVDSYMKNSGYKKSMLLDCTLRDTGYLNNWNWDYSTVKDIVYHMGDIGVDYCEIGFIKDKKYVEDGAGVWRNINSNFNIIKKLKKDTNNKTKIAVMMDIGNKNQEYFDVNQIPNQSETEIDLIRVFSFFEVIDKTYNVCKVLKEKGYTVSLNVGHCTHLEKDELQYIKDKIKSKKLHIDFLYFADSLGMLTPNEISKFMLFFKDIYPIKTGFHNHNNHGTIFGNLINLLNCNIDIIDGTLSGFGKNGGNANLEQLLLYLIIKEKYNLNIYSLLELIEKLKNIDFGRNTKININEIKIMLQQFLGVHGSYLKPIMDKSLVEIYDELSKLKNIKKDWTK